MCIVVAVVNKAKYEMAYSPIIATILHTITKQISIRETTCPRSY